MKKRAANRAWFLWIGGACFLVGSLVAGSVGLASSATTAGPTVNQGAPGSSPWPVSASGNVGLSGPLPAGSNDIGTVHVAAPKSVIGEASCAVADTFAACQSAGTGLGTGTLLNTLSVRCFVAPGHHAIASYLTGTFDFEVPLSLQMSSGGIDYYAGTLTNMAIPIQATQNILVVGEDYVASSGNGTSCALDFTGTTL